MAPLSATWSRIASSQRLERSSQCLAVAGSQAWIFGGELVPRQPVDNQVDVVRLGSSNDRPAATETLSASTSSSSPTPRVGASLVTVKDKLYLFSGRGGLEMTPIEEKGALWAYTPDDNTWELLAPSDPSAPYPCGRSYHAAAAASDSSLFIHAGCPENGRLADLWRFDPETKTWTELPSAPAPARGGPSIAVYNGKLYRMNGFDGVTEQGGAIDIYDITQKVWLPSVRFQPDGHEGPEPRSVSALVALVIADRGFLLTMFGERDPSALGHMGAGKMLGDLWAFDIEQEEWANLEFQGDTTPAPRGWFDADVLRDEDGSNAVIVHGGLAEDTSRLGDVWKLQVNSR
ncbi:kelch repeat protein [Coniochaeta sp. 2T2.1]|nr:kelch repeat protein [Coniochaeta sp. 2T2.1]